MKLYVNSRSSFTKARVADLAFFQALNMCLGISVSGTMVNVLFSVDFSEGMVDNLDT